MDRFGWRLVIAVAAVYLVVGVLAAARVGADTCATRTAALLGEPAAVTVGVTAEGVSSVVRLEITIPDGFAFDTMVPNAGWQGQRRGDVVEVVGGEVYSGACGFLLLKGTPTKNGTLVFRMRAFDADGTVRTFDGTKEFDPLAASWVEVQGPVASGGHASSGTPNLVPGALVVMVAAAVALIAAAVATLRRPHARRS